MPSEPPLQSVIQPLAPSRRQELLHLWVDGLRRTESTVAPLVDEVVAICRASTEGALVGVAWAYPAPVELIGGRTFWVLATDVARHAPAATTDALRTLAFDVLTDRSRAPTTPVGVCLPIADRDELLRRPEAIWAGSTPWHYAGYLPDGRQVRLAYFDGARIGEDGQR